LKTAPFRTFALAAAGLTLVFALPLWHLVRFALADDLYSYIPLMPVACAYLAWTLQPELPAQSFPARRAAAGFFAAAAGVLAVHIFMNHALALAVLAWLLALAGAGCWSLGGATMRALVFPFCLLLFMIPLPPGMRGAIEGALQHGSADVAEWMFILSGTPLERADTVFHLPGITLEVAPECSGIHSTWILFITSLMAGRMILRQPGRRAILCLAVIPLALLRNGFRVFVIGQLCIHIGPRMIDSPIHRHGGPIFFALSLVPLFLLLYYLHRRTPAAKPPPGAGGAAVPGK